MSDATPRTIYLKDYTPSAFLIANVDLDVAILGDHTRVTSRLTLQRNPAALSATGPLVLDGEALALESVAVNGRALDASEYAVSPEHLTIHEVPSRERDRIHGVSNLHPVRDGTRVLRTIARERVPARRFTRHPAANLPFAEPDAYADGALDAEDR